MKSFWRGAAIIALVLWAATMSQASTYSFTPSDVDVMDLDHSYYYGWSLTDNQLGNELASGRYKIASATLVYWNIRDWVVEQNDSLATFLLSSPPIWKGNQKVQMLVNGVPQYDYLFTYVNTKNNKTATRTGKTDTPPNIGSHYTLVKTEQIPRTIVLKAGTEVAPNLWERYDGQSLAEVNWGVDSSFKVVDKNGTPNPWNDPNGGTKTGINLTYEFDQNSINALTAYVIDGSAGIGIDPDCHYYNDGITLTIITAAVPEPGTLMLLGFGLVGLVAAGRRGKR